jgi:hypothetical protein
MPKKADDDDDEDDCWKLKGGFGHAPDAHTPPSPTRLSYVP